MSQSFVSTYCMLLKIAVLAILALLAHAMQLIPAVSAIAHTFGL